MRQRFLSAIVGTVSLITLLFGVGPSHSLMAAASMSDMGQQMTQNQCQTSCTSQSNPVTPGQRVNVEEKNIEPQPAEPYYLAFMGVGWSIVIIVAGFLLWHLRWRPPDIFKLNVAYRF